MRFNPGIPYRAFLVLVTFLLTVLLYIDRTVISTAKDEVMRDLSLTKEQFTWVLAVFTLGYALFQTPTGKLADKLGPRSIIAGIVSIWSALTAITGLAWNFVSMLIIRFLFGAGEAGAFPALAKVTYNWFPVKERGIVQGINFSGSRLGAAFAMPLVTWMIVTYGWKHTFLIFGVVGVLFAIFWYTIFRNKPEESNLVGEREKKYIIESRTQPAKVASKLSFAEVMKNGNVLLAMVQYIGSNFTFYFTLTWMYPLIKNNFGLDPVVAGWYASVPLIAGGLGNWISGLMVDYLYKKKGLVFSRRFPAILGFTLSAFGMLMLTFEPSVVWFTFFLAIAIMGADMTLSPSWAFCIDIGKENSGVVSGTMNMAGNLGAFFTILAFFYFEKWTGNIGTFFYVCVLLSLISIVAWVKMNPNKPVESKEV